MGWARTASKTAARYGVRYGPHVVAAWKIAGPKVEAAARSKLDEAGARRTAFDHADSVAEGSVLRVVERGHGVFVVLSSNPHVFGYLPADQLRGLAGRIDVPLSQLHAVASFYPHFQLTPPPQVDVRRIGFSATTDSIRFQLFAAQTLPAGSTATSVII